MPNRHFPFLASLLLALPATGLALNFNFLSKGPVAYFTQQDIELLTSAARNALNDSENGETVAWSNPETGHSGSLTPLSTYTQEGKTCRELKIMNSAKGRKGEGAFPFCKQPDGKWKHEASK